MTKHRIALDDLALGLALTAKASSNRSRGSKGKRAPRTLGMSVKPWAKGKQDGHSFTGPSLLALEKNSKAHHNGAQSRIHREWKDTHRKQEIASIEYHPAQWASLAAKPTRINPNRITPNRGTRRYREYSERMGSVITKTDHYWIGEEGSTYQAPASEYKMRGMPCLFDDCVSAGKADTKQQVNGHSIRYHVPSGVLPTFKASPIVKRERIEIAEGIAAWRARTQLAHAEALAEWRHA